MHEAHVSAVPFTRYLPAVHAVHCESEAVVHVSDEVHPATAVHALHTVLAVAVHAEATYCPAEHVLHATQLSTVPSTR